MSMIQSTSASWQTSAGEYNYKFTGGQAESETRSQSLGPQKSDVSINTISSSALDNTHARLMHIVLYYPSTVIIQPSWWYELPQVVNIDIFSISAIHGNAARLPAPWLGYFANIYST